MTSPDPLSVESREAYTRGDVNHNLQPLIGQLRLMERDGEPLTPERMRYFIDRMHVACQAEDAWLASGVVVPAETQREQIARVEDALTLLQAVAEAATPEARGAALYCIAEVRAALDPEPTDESIVRRFGPNREEGNRTVAMEDIDPEPTDAPPTMEDET